MDTRVKPIVVKLGGSVVTAKEKTFTPNIPSINRIVKEIAEARLDSLILIHGGGSFGHPVAREYQIVEGYKTPSQKIGFSKTRQAMMALNKLVIDTFIRQNIPVVAIQPSACITTKGGRIQHFDITAIQHFLRLGFIPVLYGDAVLDLELGFTILSGDQIAAELAMIFNAEKMVIAVDVDGLFTDDPKSNPNAKMINEISLEELNGLLDSIDVAKTVDVTKGMRGKVTELIPTVERGIQIDIVNASIADRLYKALKGEKVTGTKIMRG